MAQEKQESKYKALSQNFMRGSFAGQLSSVHRDRETNTDKVKDFKAAIKDGEIKIDSELTRGQAQKLKELGVSVPDNVTIRQGGRQAATGTNG